MRVVYDVYGVQLINDLHLGLPLAAMAAFTIIYGSLRALTQNNLKKRLAFSTVSQVSYIILGVAIYSPMATIGGLVHLVHQGLMKITLFFCAGNIAETLGIHDIDEMKGLGRRMPATMLAFTLGSLGMIGVPPMAGFISKWYLGIGSISAQQPWVILILVASSLLNCAYFLPILYKVWFEAAEHPWCDKIPPRYFETKLSLLVPPLITVALALCCGLMAQTPLSPLAWVKLIAIREYAYPIIPIVYHWPWLVQAAILATITSGLLLILPSWRYQLERLVFLAAPWLALPPLLWSLQPNLFVGNFPSLLMHSQFAVDPVARPLVAVVSILWLLAGIFSYSYLANDPRRLRFSLFYMITFIGNIGVLLAQDLISFYCLFAVMTFGAYGLIVHDGKPASRRAGRIYLVISVIGEGLLIAALMWLSHLTGKLSLPQLWQGTIAPANLSWIVPLLFISFGIKMGVLALHVWLPLAHPCAPTPASAVLSGAILKAGLIGWLRFLPLGHLALPLAGTSFVIAGMATAFYGAVVGAVQWRPKTVLAYSSISQMGLLTAGVGLALIAPEMATQIIAALTLFASHHALTKGSLFLSTGIVPGIYSRKYQGWLFRAILTFLALSLAGIPLSTGSLAKLALKTCAAGSSTAVATWLTLLLPLSSIATTLVMLRFLYLIWPDRSEHHPRPGSWAMLAWTMLSICACFLPWIWAGYYQQHLVSIALTPAYTVKTTWPILAGIVITGGALLLHYKWPTYTQIRIPEGDLLELFLLPQQALISGWQILANARQRINDWLAQPSWLAKWWQRSDRILAQAEVVFATYPVVGPLFLLICLSLLLMAAG